MSSAPATCRAITSCSCEQLGRREAVGLLPHDAVPLRVDELHPGLDALARALQRAVEHVADVEACRPPAAP